MDMTRDQFLTRKEIEACTHPDLPKNVFAYVGDKVVRLFKIEGEKTYGPITLSRKASAVFIARMNAEPIFCACAEPEKITIDWEKGIYGCTACGFPVLPG